MKLKVELNEGRFSESDIHVHKGDRIKIFVDGKLVFEDDKCEDGL